MRGSILISESRKEEKKLLGKEGGDEMIVYITTCSMVKKGQGEPTTHYKWDYNVVSELLATRKKILDTMKSSLKKPAAGPDFGGNSTEGQYLRAFERYILTA